MRELLCFCQRITVIHTAQIFMHIAVTNSQLPPHNFNLGSILQKSHFLCRYIVRNVSATVLNKVSYHKKRCTLACVTKIFGHRQRHDRLHKIFLSSHLV